MYSMCRTKKDALTKQENIFLNEYIKTCDGIKSLLLAYPNAEKWSSDAKYAQINKILNRPRINQRLQAHNERVAGALAQSTTLNKRKILDEIIRQYTETSTNGASERTNSVALLKLMAQISKLLDNTPAVAVQVNNNVVASEVSDYLNL